MNNCAVCVYRESGPFGKLSDKALTELSRSFAMRCYRGGEIIFYQGDPLEDFYFLCGGTVKLIRETPGGKQSIVNIVGPCGWFGELSFSSGAVQSVTAEAVQAAVVNSIHRPAMAEVFQQEPGLLLEMMEKLSVLLRKAWAHNAELAHQPVRLRALNLLVRLFDRYGRRENGHWVLGIPLARADLAEMLGATPETTIRTLAQLQREGHLRLGRRRISLADPEGFRSLSERESLAVRG